MKFSITATLCALVLLAPLPSLAFSKDSVDRSGFVFPDKQTALFTLEVPVGGFKDDIYLPAIGQRDLPHGAGSGYFGYQIDSGMPVGQHDGNASAFILSTAEVVDGMYKIPANSITFITIVATLRVNENESNIYRLIVNELPFFFGEARTPNQFSTGELKYLVTNYEALNFEQDPE